MERRSRSCRGGAARNWPLSLACCVLPLVVTACVKPVDLKQALEVTNVTSGWFDAGVISGRNKIVPFVRFKLRHRSPADLDRVSVNALFRAADGKESELDSDVYLQRVDFQGAETAPVPIRAENGYTADPPQSRADMLTHSQFRDMRVQILVKHGSAQWTDLGWFDIKRQLITQ